MTPSAIEVDTSVGVEHECPECGSARLRRELVKSAIWQGERLIVVEGIPALLCEACGERFYDDGTVTQLDLMQGEGFPQDGTGRVLKVPVISFMDRLVAAGEADSEEAA